MVLGNITPCRPLIAIITHKLIYTRKWLRSHMDVCGFNSDDWLHGEDEFSIAFKVNYISEDLTMYPPP